MKRMHMAAAALVALAAVAGAHALVTAAPAKAGKSSAEKIARGKYLVDAGGCNDCHTPGTFYGAPDFSRFLSGSELAWEGPWGLVFAANLTNDRETGLGAWTEEQIATALQTGNRPDGRQLAPIMPWMNLSKLTREDARAIAAYLLTVPAVKHAVPAPVPPGGKWDGPILRFPPPPAWDAPRSAPGGSGN